MTESNNMMQQPTVPQERPLIPQREPWKVGAGERRGRQTAVMQYLWHDGCNYCNCHGPLVRGVELPERNAGLTQDRQASR